jgi:hypothetical protein
VTEEDVSELPYVLSAVWHETALASICLYRVETADEGTFTDSSYGRGTRTEYWFFEHLWDAHQPFRALSGAFGLRTKSSPSVPDQDGCQWLAEAGPERSDGDESTAD